MGVISPCRANCSPPASDRQTHPPRARPRRDDHVMRTHSIHGGYVSFFTSPFVGSWLVWSLPHGYMDPSYKRTTQDMLGTLSVPAKYVASQAESAGHTRYVHLSWMPRTMWRSDSPSSSSRWLISSCTALENWRTLALAFHFSSCALVWWEVLVLVSGVCFGSAFRKQSLSLTLQS